MKNCLFGWLLLGPALSVAQTPAPAAYAYYLTGKLGQLTAPAKVYLVNGPQVLDSATLRQGRFELKGTTEFPHSATLVLERQGRLQSGWREIMLGGKLRKAFLESPDRTRLFLEPGPVVVTSADSLRTAHLAGGPLTADYQQLEGLTKRVEGKRKKTDSPAQSDALAQEIVQANLAFVKAHPTSWVSLEALQQARMWSPPQYNEVAPLYAALSPAQRASPPGQFYGQMLTGLRASAIGGEAPAFTQLTPSGQAVSLADYRGKYVLVDFWASWCTPCRAENPAVLKAYEAFKGRNFEVLGVSLDEKKTRAAWVKAIADDHMPWVQVSDLHGFESPVAQQYGVKSIPQNFLVDPSGKIVASNLRGDHLLETLAKFLK